MFKPMKPAELEKCLPRLRQRFPELDCADKSLTSDCIDKFIDHLALVQQISVSEAREEISDFFYLESLHEELERS